VKGAGEEFCGNKGHGKKGRTNLFVPWEGGREGTKKGDEF